MNKLIKTIIAESKDHYICDHEIKLSTPAAKLSYADLLLLLHSMSTATHQTVVKISQRSGEMDN